MIDIKFKGCCQECKCLEIEYEQKIRTMQTIIGCSHMPVCGEYNKPTKLDKLADSTGKVRDPNKDLEEIRGHDSCEVHSLCCENRKYRAQSEDVCVNADSDMAADFTDRDYVCNHQAGLKGGVEDKSGILR